MDGELPWMWRPNEQLGCLSSAGGLTGPRLRVSCAADDGPE